jgi:PTS system glucose-specific IIC component
MLAAVAYFVCIELGIKHGMTFSHGFIDFVLLFNRSTHGLWFLWLGPIWAAMYYGLFRWLIRRRDLKTPGRELEIDSAIDTEPVAAGGLAQELVLAFGGRRNIHGLDACITRLRVQLVDMKLARPDRLRALGATGVVTVGNNMQAIFGTRSENLKSDMEVYLRTAGSEADLPESAGAAPAVSVVAQAAPPVAPGPAATGAAAAFAEALGGAGNVLEIESRAMTRLRVRVRDASRVDDAALRAAGAHAVMRLDRGILHLIIGPAAAEYAAAMAVALR